MKLSHLKPLMVFKVFLWTTWCFFWFYYDGILCFHDFLSWNQSKVSCTGATYSFLLLCRGKTSKVQKSINADMKAYCMFYCMFSSYENNMLKTSKNRIKELWHELFHMGFYVYVNKSILSNEKNKVRMTLTPHFVIWPGFLLRSAFFECYTMIR